LEIGQDFVKVREKVHWSLFPDTVYNITTALKLTNYVVKKIIHEITNGKCLTSERINTDHFSGFDSDGNAVAFAALNSDVHHTKNTQIQLD